MSPEEFLNSCWCCVAVLVKLYIGMDVWYVTWRQGGFCKLPSAPIHSYMSGGCNAYTTLVVGITVLQGRAESDIWLHCILILHLEALLVSSKHASPLKKGFGRFDPSAKGTSIPFFSSGLDKILS